MALLSPLFLLFGLFGVVPLVLHLYHRRKRVVVEFSTNRFFTESVIQSQRRMQLQRLLLMLLRIAACILLAFAMSRPILEMLGLAGAAGKRDLVIVLDDSLSMCAADAAVAAGADRATRFDRAKAIAAATLKELVRGDRAAIVTFSGQSLGRLGLAGVEFTDDPARLLNDLQLLRPTRGTGEPFWAVEQAQRLFDSPQQRARLLMIVTDLQANQWPQSTWPQPREPIQTVLAQVDSPTRRNVVAEFMRLSQAMAVVGLPNTLEVRLVNHDAATTTAELIVEVDGKRAAQRPVEVPGQSVRVEHVPVRFDRPEPGEPGRKDERPPADEGGPTAHRLKVQVAVPDALPEDNTLFATVQTTSRLPVLLVDGQAGRNRRRTPAFYLHAALRASVAEGDSIPVDMVGLGEVPKQLDTYRVVILAAVPNLSKEVLGDLEAFVRAGGGLLMFLGNGTDTAFYNQVMGASDRPLGGLLPGTIGRAVMTEAKAEPMHIVEAQWDHAIFQRFTGVLRSALAAVDVRRAFEVQPREAWAIARLDGAMPLMVERAYGRGRVILVATSPQPQWTDLPLRKNFIPLMNRMVSYLAGGGGLQAAGEVGQEFVVLRGRQAANGARVMRPDGAPVAAAVRAAGAQPEAYLPKDLVAEPGFYEIRSSAEEAEGATPASAVNCPRSESVSDVMAIDLARQFSGNWKLTHVDLGRREGQAGGAADVAGAIDKVLGAGKVSRGLWDTLLWVVLAILVAEPVIANRIGRRRAQRSAQAGRAASAGRGKPSAEAAA